MNILNTLSVFINPAKLSEINLFKCEELSNCQQAINWVVNALAVYGITFISIGFSIFI